MEENDFQLDERLKNAAYINLDAPNTKTTAALNIYADDIDIQAITEMLGCTPTESHKKGDIIKLKSPPARTGRWGLEAPDDLSLIGKISYLLEKTTSDQLVWDTLVTTHTIRLNLAIFLHSWTDGFDFPPATMSEIVRRHWQFGFSVYSAEGEEIVEAFLKKAKHPPNNISSSD